MALTRGTRLTLEVDKDRATGNRNKLQRGKFQLAIRKTFYQEDDHRCWRCRTSVLGNT